MTEAIRISGLTRRYGSLTAVDHLDLTVEQGELIALLGVNGAGKTTTVRMLAGLVRPDEGDAFLLGHSITKEPEAVKRIIGVSPQETATAPNLTVRENLEMMAQLYGLRGKEMKEKCAELTRVFSLEKVEKRKTKALSGGWQRRVSIAMAMVSNPQILFLDEPTLGLDVMVRRELWSFIRSLKGKITVILTTHYMEEAEFLADHVAVMKDGKLRAFGTVAELEKLTGCEHFEDAFINLVTDGGAEQ